MAKTTKTILNNFKIIANSILFYLIYKGIQFKNSEIENIDNYESILILEIVQNNVENKRFNYSESYYNNFFANDKTSGTTNNVIINKNLCIVTHRYNSNTNKFHSTTINNLNMDFKLENYLIFFKHNNKFEFDLFNYSKSDTDDFYSFLKTYSGNIIKKSKQQTNPFNISINKPNASNNNDISSSSVFSEPLNINNIELTDEDKNTPLFED